MADIKKQDARKPPKAEPKQEEQKTEKQSSCGCGCNQPLQTKVS